ncbi:MAG: UDP-2,3-diacylglucosamine diphosphatase [Gammaproteobacteria bacterium]|nr:UDP-2,3-diacylglucosamine diphosphatase [Gammaproteobacteria bacterium]
MSNNVVSINPNSFRSVFISDVHLGTKDCRAEYLADFLKTIDCETLYLVGDIVDVWSMRSSVYWPQAHNDVIRSILKLAKNGTKVVFIPGNHDEVFRDYVEHNFGNIQIQKRLIHTTADNRRFLVLHGDEFDGIVTCSKLLSFVGDFAYDGLLFCNRTINKFRQKAGLPYWSLANYLKAKVKNAISYISRFEDAAVQAARHDKVNGVICGHIHHANIKEQHNILYCNTGDWVESCTAIAEKHHGELTLIHWTEHKKYLKSDRNLATDKLAKAS